jgi:hypothetical protein
MQPLPVLREGGGRMYVLLKVSNAWGVVSRVLRPRVLGLGVAVYPINLYLDIQSHLL